MTIEATRRGGQAARESRIRPRARNRRATNGFRPACDALEPRVVLSGAGYGAFPAGPFALSGPATNPGGAVAAQEIPLPPFPIPEIPIPGLPNFTWPPRFDIPVPDIRLPRIPDLADPCDPVYLPLYRAQTAALASAVGVVSGTGADFIRHFLDGDGSPINNPPGVREKVEAYEPFKQWREQAVENLERAIQAANGDPGTTIPRLARPQSIRFNETESPYLFGAYAGTRGTFADYANISTREVDANGDGTLDSIEYTAEITFTILDRFVIDPGDRWGDRYFNFLKKMQDCGYATPFDTNIVFTETVTGVVPRGVPLDLVFVIDTTGSMWDDIDAVKAASAGIVAFAQALSPDVRFGLVTFRDAPFAPFGEPTDYQSRLEQGLTPDAAAVNAAIQALGADGGADWPESVYSGLVTALTNPGGGGWRADARRVIILMGDAPPHDPEPVTGFTMATVAALSRAVEVGILGPLAASLEARGPSAANAGTAMTGEVDIYTLVIGFDSEAIDAYARIAELNRGQAFRSASANDVVDDLTAAIAAGARPLPVFAASVETATPIVRPGETATLTIQAIASNPAENEIFTYLIDWDADGVADAILEGGSTIQVSRPFEESGPVFPIVRVVRADGRSTEASTAFLVAPVALLADPLNPFARALYVTGTDDADFIRVGRSADLWFVEFNGATYATSTPVSRVIVDGRGGDDVLAIDPSVTVPALARGGHGNDILVGGGIATILVGGAGDDVVAFPRGFAPAAARYVVIGGAGSDDLDITHRRALVVAAATVHDDHDAALFSILDEWAAPRTENARLANIRGTGTLRARNLPVFLTPELDLVPDETSNRVYTRGRSPSLILGPYDRVRRPGWAWNRWTPRPAANAPANAPDRVDPPPARRPTARPTPPKRQPLRAGLDTPNCGCGS